jgi:glycosyltransferase involved in cell wall biosynthesis
MKVLQIKSIPGGSSSYVSDMLRIHLNKYCRVDDAPNIRSIGFNPIRLIKFYILLSHYDIHHVHLGKAARWVRFLDQNKINVATLHGFQRIRHYRGIDSFVAVSRAVRMHFIAQGVLPAAITVIPNGVEEKFFHIPFKKKDRVFTICQVGHLTKNLELSLHVIAILKRRGHRLEFLIAGSEKDPGDFSGLIDSLGIREEVRFLGFVAEIENVYRRADLLISSSVKEGFHLPVLEAMASGRPVVTTDSQGVRDFFTDGENGYFAPFSPELFADAVDCLIASPDTVACMGIKNRHRASSYRWEKVAELYFDYFQQLYNRKFDCLQNRGD